MSKHPREVEGFKGNMHDLAGEIGNMTYDQVANLIYELCDDIKSQASADVKRGRMKLAEKLFSVSTSLDMAGREMSAAWKICKPFMDG